MSPTNINLRAAEARQLLDAGRVEVVRVMRPQPNAFVGSYPFWRAEMGWLCIDDVVTLRCPLPAPGAVVACREPWGVYHQDIGDVRADRWNVYKADGKRTPGDNGIEMPWRPAPSCPRYAIRLHARVESRGAEVRDGKWCWVAVVVREENQSHG